MIPNDINSQVGCTFSKRVVMSCITAVRAVHFVTVNVRWQPGSSLQPMWQELPHTFCFISAFSSLNLSRRLRWSFWRLTGLAPPVQRIIVMSKFQTKQPGESPAESGLSVVKSDWDETMLSPVPLAFTTLRYTTLKQGTRQQSKRRLITATLTCGCWWVAECYLKARGDWHTTLLPLPISARTMSDIYENGCWRDFSLNET